LILAQKAEEVNEACINAENIQKITEISRNIGLENLLTPTRKFIFESEVDIHSSVHTGPAKCFLFNDLFVFVSRKGKHKTPYSVPLCLCWAENGESPTSLNIITTISCISMNFSSLELKQSLQEKFEQSLCTQLEINPKDKVQRGEHIVVEENGQKIVRQANDSDLHAEGKTKKKGLLDKWKREVKSKRRKKRSQTEEKIIEHLCSLQPTNTKRKLSMPHSGSVDIIQNTSPHLDIQPGRLGNNAAPARKSPVPALKKSQSFFRLPPSAPTRTAAPLSSRRGTKN